MLVLDAILSLEPIRAAPPALAMMSFALSSRCQTHFTPWRGRKNVCPWHANCVPSTWWDDCGV